MSLIWLTFSPILASLPWQQVIRCIIPLSHLFQDVVTRYAHQNGFHVERRFGWDCHGLPVEYEIDKTLGIKTPDDVKKMGVAAYNAECRKIVMRYAQEWEV
jgi:isoleucyl-tRNA synthetase